METILRLLNDYLVLIEYEANDEALGVYDELWDEIYTNKDEANKLIEYASDFQNSFRDLRELGFMNIISPTNIRIYIGELLEAIEQAEEEEEEEEN